MPAHAGTCLCQECCERFVHAFNNAVTGGTVDRIADGGREKMHRCVDALVDWKFGEVELLSNALVAYKAKHHRAHYYEGD